LDAGRDLDEGAERFEPAHRAWRGASCGKLLFECRPGIDGECFERQADLAAPAAVGLSADLDDLRAHRLPDRKNVARVRDARVAELAHVNHSLHAAEIDERAEVAYGSHGAVEHRAHV